MTDEELTDLIAEAIDESMDVDWTSRDGARAVLTALREANVLPVWRTIETAPRDELDPCPFCGGRGCVIPVAFPKSTRFCVECIYHACHVRTPCFSTEAEAITVWNAHAPDPRLAEVTAERDGLRAHLAWYADTFCEQGPYSEVCGRLGPDECSGCRARAALGAKP